MLLAVKYGDLFFKLFATNLAKRTAYSVALLMFLHAACICIQRIALYNTIITILARNTLLHNWLHVQNI